MIADISASGDSNSSSSITIPPSLFQLISDSFLKTDDLLLKLNAIELFQQLGQSEQGRRFLSSNEVVEKIGEQLTSEVAMMDDRVVPTCVLFLAYAMRINGCNESDDSKKKSKELYDKFYKSSMEPLLKEFAYTPPADPSSDYKKFTLLKVFSELSQLEESVVPGIEAEVCSNGDPLLYSFAKGCLTSTNVERCKSAICSFISYPNGGNTSDNKIRTLHSILPIVVDVWANKCGSNPELRPFVYQLLQRGAEVSTSDNCVKFLLIESGHAFRSTLLEPCTTSESSHDARVEKSILLKKLIENPRTVEVLGGKTTEPYAILKNAASRGAYGIRGQKKGEDGEDDTAPVVPGEAGVKVGNLGMSL